jgi:arylsulfatase A-like enzyme
VVLFVDDLGFGDLATYGNTVIKTPNIDQLAREGTKFTSWYSAAPICTPSRAGLLSGRLPARFGMDDPVFRVMISAQQSGGYPLSEVSLADALKSGGYRTGMTGKWHMGHNQFNATDATFLPINQGFDYSGLVSTLGNNPGCDPYTNDITPFFCFFNRGNQVTQQPWRTENLAAREVREFSRFLAQTPSSAPFFWYHSFTAVHTPLFASFPFNNSAGGLYGGMVEEMDWEVGQLMNIIRLIPNTVVFFVSDNGPYLENFVYLPPSAGVTSAGPFKGGKGQSWEGGFRVPGIAWMPGFIPAGRVSDNIVSTMDIYPTVLGWAGVPLPTDRVIDGKDLSDLLLDNHGGANQDPWKNEIYPYFCGTNLFAARWKKFKAHYITPDFVDFTGAPTPANECHGQCCPYDPNGLFPIGVCGCSNFNPLTGQVQQRVTVQNPPLLFDLSKDIAEANPLTPDNFPDYATVMAVINPKVDALLATITPVPSQLNTPYLNQALQPCCGTVCSDLGIVVPCRCNYEGV